LQLRRRIKATDKAIEDGVGAHPQAAIMRSLPGMEPLVAAEFTVAVGDLSSFPSADHLAACAGLAPVPRDSGRVGFVAVPALSFGYLTGPAFLLAAVRLRARGGWRWRPRCTSA
jgi:transposase